MSSDSALGSLYSVGLWTQNTAPRLRMTSIRLTPLSPVDAVEMFDVLAPLEIYSEMEEAPPPSIAALTQRYQSLARQESPDEKQAWLNWVIRDDETDKAMGFVQATIERSSNVALIAYVVNPRSWGKGIATKAVSKMLKSLNQDYGVTQFRATVNDSNARSIKLLRQFGFGEIARTPIAGGKMELVLEFQMHSRRSQFGWEGDNGIGELLIAQIIAGSKTATAAPLSLYTDAEWIELRESVGKPVTVNDKDGNPRCNIRITNVIETTFGNPDPRLVKGEGYGTDAKAFQRSHETAWADLVAQGRLKLDASTVLAVELFERIPSK
jgi:uncharacterized protein YhfF/RimJ/RimL family protein N-acetyltransferase